MIHNKKKQISKIRFRVDVAHQNNKSWFTLNDLLAITLQYGRIDLFDYLWNKYSYIQWDYKVVLNYSFSLNSTEPIKYLFKRYFDTSPDTDSLLTVQYQVLGNAAMVGDVDLLDHIFGYSVEADDQKPRFNKLLMVKAIKGQHEKVVKFLVDRIPSMFSSSGTLPLEFAFEQRNTGVIKLLIEKRAARLGDIELLEWLYNRMAKEQEDPQVFKSITLGTIPNLATIQWFEAHSFQINSSTPFLESLNNRFNFYRMDPEPFSLETLNIAKYIHFNRSESYSERAMENAVASGNLELVQFLNFNRTEGSKSNLIDIASTFGFLDILRWLHYNNSGGCSTEAMDYSCLHGHLQIVQFLHENRSEGCSVDILDKDDGSSKSLEILKWFYENRTERITQPHNLLTRILATPIVNLELYQWVYEHVPQEVQSEMENPEHFFKCNNYLIIRWLLNLKKRSMSDLINLSVRMKSKYPFSIQPFKLLN
ncbi:hypothetical protein PPL_05379 [Heterostelium album PN500]|uniref:Ankyrin repeat protein n=1 Tax=Heterostelium pallidum (strain ATCC 26659 / Pp 5 / PN500) TaxID=670386 RepID=D3BA07_HETP5|nr:hypothetical protein PPL_05379 [Heterostelium album PN500]EFA81394.1 hypothetical protein PPL_05379 [Heterostelium album PN500]|eukprot:XP_020433512.1 hypothetical protein PPL_05379 [Heterostelium album PN500]